MTSLDDTIISKQNLILLDNVTNYGRPAVDYFTQEFKAQDIAITWRLLVKMRNHKLLRLPSCSPEDDKDYHLYLVRLHHVLWRRWSQLVVATGERVDPLSLNWDKDLDVTVLYGPDLAHKKAEEEEQRDKKKAEREARAAAKDAKECDESWEVDSASMWSSDSNSSSIFDRASKNLRFSETVLRRDIDPAGLCYESHVLIKRPVDHWDRVWS
ncbi:YKR075C and YOR062C [Zygosaccharomyces parabailii]|nr:YKR075C and YOR062C [Zygosaccharomyces parabailii]CDH14236.1 uncharacterized protein ZBAI_06022 [Zygosaccharomyces bailii ISA1307]